MNAVKQARPGVGWWLLLLWFAALALSLTGLGNLPLRDWDEGIVARVALETSLSPWSEKWLPTYWWDDYLNKPPGLHWLIAAAIASWRALTHPATDTLPPEWVVRLVPAVISTSLVPLLGALQLRLRPGDRGSAIATAAITLTLLPLARHGRLAMLDGCQLVAMTGLWWALIGARNSTRTILGWGVTAGLAVSVLLLLKAPVALPLLLASLLLRALDRELNARQWLLLIAAVLLGALPGCLWHLLHAAMRGEAAWHMWGSQGLARVHSALEGHGGGPIPPLIEVVEGGGPWLLLWPIGIAAAWRQRRGRWGRWCLGITLTTAAMVLPLQTQLPWYSLLLWPGFCLSCGPVLAGLVGQRRDDGWPTALWTGLGLALVAVALIAVLVSLPLPPLLLTAGLAVGAGLSAGGWMLRHHSFRQRRQGAIALVAGLWLGLLLLMGSDHWLWELNESWSTPQAAAMLRRHDQPRTVLLQQGERPSLNWYADERIGSGTRQLRRALSRAPSVAVISAETPQLRGVHCRELERQGALALYQCLGSSDS